MNRDTFILVIEDDLSDYTLIKNFLGKSRVNYLSENVQSIAAATTYIAENTQIDVILLDLHLPDAHGGIETLGQILSLISVVPIIVLSGLKDDVLALEAVKRGAQDYLTKSDMTPDSLHRSINYSIERKLVMNELLQTKKMASIGTLAGGIAHDFNNLLTIILGYAEMALSNCGDDESMSKHLTEIKNASTTAKDLTQQLLTFSRNKPQKKTISNLNTTINVMEKTLLRLMSENVKIELHLADNLFNNMVDTAQVERIIMNLCLNAQDALDERGGKIIISTQNLTFESSFEEGITRIPKGQYTRLRVQDNGRGIPKELMENIFEPFFTTKKLGESHHGAGMGLSIVYGAVNEAGGYIIVDSVLTQGSVFDIYFPRCIEAQSSGRIIDQQEDPGPDEGLKGIEILVVEDEGGVRELVQQILKNRGFTIKIASTPSEALEISAACDHFDLILSDVLMPEMNGQELAEEILKDKPFTPVIFMSGYTEDVLLTKGIDKKENFFLMKPFTPRELNEVVDKALKAKPNPLQKEAMKIEFPYRELSPHAGKVLSKEIKVLIVDDHLTSAKIVDRFLSSYTQCEYVDNGFDAIIKFEEAHEAHEPYDLILLDVMMPQLSGIETMEKIRGLEEKHKDLYDNTVKIILLTAIEESIDNLLLSPNMFYDAYLQKPVVGKTILKEMELIGLKVRQQKK
jgi:CheY-like chemotaxis protein